jgi:acyl carrier protein
MSLEDFIQRNAARILGMDAARLDLDQPLDTVGLDSLMAIELKNSLESKLGINLSIASLLQGSDDLQSRQGNAWGTGFA